MNYISLVGYTPRKKILILRIGLSDNSNIDMKILMLFLVILYTYDKAMLIKRMFMIKYVGVTRN